MNEYMIYLNNGNTFAIKGHSYLIDKDKGYLYILDEKKWKIGVIFLNSISGFTIKFGERRDVNEA